MLPIRKSQESYRSEIGGLLLAFWLFVAGALTSSYGAHVEQRLVKGWSFCSVETSATVEPPSAASWVPVVLPHDWSINLPVAKDSVCSGHGGFFQTGIGWYHRDLPVPSAWSGRHVCLKFEGSAGCTEVWFNGHYLGKHFYAFTSFQFDITPYLRVGGNNHISVRVDNSAQPSARWYTGSGLYRPVWVLVTDSLHIASDGVFAVTEKADGKLAIIRLDVRVRNESEVSHECVVETEVRDSRNRLVATAMTPAIVPAGKERIATVHLSIDSPMLWSPAHPVLYHVQSRVRKGRKIWDEYEKEIGLRTIRVSAENGFELNGCPIKLLGGNVHSDVGILGAAAFERADERKVMQLKAAGFNAVRTAHNPPSIAFLEACDRIGLLVIDEIFDGWAQPKTKFDYSRYFTDWSVQDLTSWVLRDRGHPSVVAWSIGNEVYERASHEGAATAQRLADCIRRLDRSRPITAGINGAGKGHDWTEVDPLFANLDFAGYNYELVRHGVDHARISTRVIFASESYASETFANWQIVSHKSYVVGDFVWCALDYLGEAGIGRVFPPDQAPMKHWEANMWPWHGAICGDIDLTGWRKPVSHYRQIVWDAGERLYVAVRQPTPDGRPWNTTPWSMPPAQPSWTWSGSEGLPLVVDVYSRYDAVRLVCNGRVVGEAPTDEAHAFANQFTVPYTPGEIEAIGISGGHEVERTVLRTAKSIVGFRLTVDHSRLHADSQDLAYVVIEGVDAFGTVNPEVTPDVVVEVKGPGKLQGLGSADMTSSESYSGSSCHLFQGRALAVVRASDHPGTITVHVSAPGLPTASLQLESLSP